MKWKIQLIVVVFIVIPIIPYQDIDILKIFCQLFLLKRLISYTLSWCYYLVMCGLWLAIKKIFSHPSFLPSFLPLSTVPVVFFLELWAVSCFTDKIAVLTPSVLLFFLLLFFVIFLIIKLIIMSRGGGWVEDIIFIFGFFLVCLLVWVGCWPFINSKPSCDGVDIFST